MLAHRCHRIDSIYRPAAAMIKYNTASSVISPPPCSYGRGFYILAFITARRYKKIGSFTIKLSYIGTADMSSDRIASSSIMNALYGQMCQVYDDIREIDDDRKNGYFSLPISIALQHGYDLDSTAGRERAVARPKEIAEKCFQDI